VTERRRGRRRWRRRGRRGGRVRRRRRRRRRRYTFLRRRSRFGVALCPAPSPPDDCAARVVRALEQALVLRARRGHDALEVGPGAADLTARVDRINAAVATATVTLATAISAALTTRARATHVTPQVHAAALAKLERNTIGRLLGHQCRGDHLCHQGRGYKAQRARTTHDLPGAGSHPEVLRSCVISRRL